MAVLSRSVYVLAIIEALITAFVALLSFAFVAQTPAKLFIVAFIFVVSIITALTLKGFYSIRKYRLKDIYLLFEGIFIASFAATALSVPVLGGFAYALALYDIGLIFTSVLLVRIVFLIYKKFLKPVKNILIVGAGQDGKLIAEEIQSRPELGMKVV